MPILDNIKNIRSFGRINSRGITKEKCDILNDKLTKYSVKTTEISNNVINHLEIGFGYGESIAGRAIINKNINYIACETYTKGVLNLIDLIEKNNINNINIFNGDARILIESLPNESIDMVFILFPDPWLKKKQQKRRIISDDFLSLLSSKIKNGGKLFFASDIENYIDWTIDKVRNNKNFIENFDNKNIEPSWWIKTKYQQKAIEENRASTFLEWTKK